MKNKNLMFAAVMALALPVFAETAAPATALKADVKIATDVQNREPAGVADSFGAEVPAVAAWCRVTGAEHPTEITQIWKRNGEEVGRIPLKVQSASYRTYSRKSVAGLPGNWSVEVVDAAGVIIGSADFNVMPQGSNATTTK